MWGRSKILYLVLVSAVLWIFIPESWARRCRNLPQSIYTFTPEELELVNAGYTLIYNAQSGELIGRVRGVTNEFLAGHNGIIVKKRLAKHGILNFGKSHLRVFPEYSEKPVIFEMPRNLSISHIFFFDENGSFLDEKDFTKIKIYDLQGNLLDFNDTLNREYFQQLHNVIIETRLDKNGYLQIGGKIRGHFKDYPGSKVRIKVVNGIITEISFLNGGGDVIERREAFLVMDCDFNLMDSFWRVLPPVYRQGIFYIRYPITQRKFSFKRCNFRLPEKCVGKIGFIKIRDGRAVDIFVVHNREVIFGNPPDNFVIKNWMGSND
jgi:hypothetical protein